MVDNNDSLFREVDEEIRREQFQKFWQRYGTYVIGAAAAILIGVGGYKFNESSRIKAAEAAGATYEAAAALATAGKLDEAAKAFSDIAATGPKGYAALASLSEAGTLLKAGKRTEALAAFEALGKNSAADPILASFAQLQAAALRMGEADFTEIQNRLKPLASDKSPWRLLALEYLGVAAVKAGKLDEARTTLSPLLADPLLPQGAAERIRRVMDTIASAELAKGTTPAPAAPAPDAGTKTEPPAK